VSPTYDFRCGDGHTTEERTERSTRGIPCPECGQSAQRLAVSLGRTPGITGIVQVPMRERRLPMTRFIEAQHTLVHEAEKAHVEVPDLWARAKTTAHAIQKHRPDLINAEGAR
jgi:hypothetical protein